MSGLLSWFSGKNKANPYTLRDMRSVTNSNQSTIIEALRSLAEIMIYGDKNSEAFFELFCEKKMITLMNDYLRQDCPNEVKIQVIQTMSILVQNIKSETTLNYILSGNHINDLITAPINFEDESITAYFVSFLKVLSLQLNSNTIQFFYNSTTEKSGNAFPLYSVAIQFYNNSESMIRIAVKTITLTVYKLEDEKIRSYVTNDKNREYFINLVNYLKDQVILSDAVLSQSTIQAHARLDDISEDTVDLLYYIQDILLIGAEEINTILCSLLLSDLVWPLAFTSLTSPDSLPEEGNVCTAMGLHLLQLILSFVDYQPLITRIAELLLSPSVPDIPPLPVTKSRSESISGDKLLSNVRIRFKSVDAQFEDKAIPFNSAENIVNSDISIDEVDDDATPGIDTEYLPASNSHEAITPRGSDFNQSQVVSNTSNHHMITRRLSMPTADPRLPHGKSTETIEFNTDDNGFRAMIYALLLHEDERYKTQSVFLLYSILVNKNVDEGVLEKANFSPQSFRAHKRMVDDLTSSINGGESSIFDQSNSSSSPSSSKAVKYPYPYKAVENILKMIQFNNNNGSEPPLRLVTVDVCRQILLRLLYDEKQSVSFIPEHQDLLNQSCQNVGMRLRQYIRDKGYDIIPIIESEWIKFINTTFDPDLLTKHTHLLLPVNHVDKKVKDIYFVIPTNNDNLIQLWINYYFILQDLRLKICKIPISNEFLSVVEPHSPLLVGDVVDMKDDFMKCFLISSYNINRPFYISLDDSFLYLMDCDGMKNKKAKIVSVINLHRISLYFDKASKKVIKIEVQSPNAVPLGLKVNKGDDAPRWELTFDFDNIEICQKLLQRIETSCETSKTQKLLQIDRIITQFMKITHSK